MNLSTVRADPQTGWQLALGAQVTPEGVRFRLWAPKATSVEVILEQQPTNIVYPLEREEAGYWSGPIAEAKPGMVYRYRLNGEGVFPDPCARFQPEGPHGPSLIVDPTSYRWRDQGWRGIQMHGQVIYEMHMGAFTKEGTFDAAIEHLEELKHLGVTVLEILPVAEFPGRWNWGYDGVGLFAPTRVYGDSDAFKRFVDAAHERGLAVMLDVVYNHLGPDGNYIHNFTDDFFTDR